MAADAHDIGSPLPATFTAFECTETPKNGFERELLVEDALDIVNSAAEVVDRILCHRGESACSVVSGHGFWRFAQLLARE